VVVASLRDSLKLSRRRASLVCFVLLLALGLPSALSYTPLKASLMGLKVLDFMDLFFGSLGLILCATLISLAIGWSPCISLLWEEALRGLQDQVAWVVPKVVFKGRGTSVAGVHPSFKPT